MENGNGKNINNDQFENGNGVFDVVIDKLKHPLSTLGQTLGYIPHTYAEIASVPLKIAGNLTGLGAEEEEEQGYEPKNEVEEYLLSEGVENNNLTLDTLDFVAQEEKEVMRFETIIQDPLNDSVPETNNIHKELVELGSMKGMKITYSNTLEEVYASMDEQIELHFPESNVAGAGLHILERYDKDLIIESIKLTCNGNKQILIQPKEDDMYYASLFTEIYEESNPNMEYNLNPIYENRNDDQFTAANNETIDMTKSFSLEDIFGKNSFFGKSFYISCATFEWEIVFCPTLTSIFKDVIKNVSRRSLLSEIPMLTGEYVRNPGNTAGVELLIDTNITNLRGVLINENDVPFEQAVQDDESQAVWSIANPIESLLKSDEEYFDIEEYNDNNYNVSCTITQSCHEIPSKIVPQLDRLITFLNYDVIEKLNIYKTETNNLQSWIKFNLKIGREDFENQLKALFICNLRKEHPIASTHGTYKEFEESNYNKFTPRNNLPFCKKINVKIGFDYFVRLDEKVEQEGLEYNNDNVITYFKNQLKFMNITEDLSKSAIFIGEDKLAKYENLDDIEIECEFELKDKYLNIPYLIPDVPNHEYNYEYDKYKLKQEDFIVYAMCDTYSLWFGKGSKFINLETRGQPEIE